MPPFLRLLPLPRRLTDDLPAPVAAGIGFVVTLPSTAARLAVTLPQVAIAAGLQVMSRYAELVDIGTAAVAGPATRGAAEPDAEDDGDVEENDDDLFPAYGLDTGAWGGTDPAEVVALLDIEETIGELDPAAADLPDVPEVIATDPHDSAQALAAAIEDRARPTVTTPDRGELPVADYDGLSATAVRSRLAGLTGAQLVVLRDHEAGHARRVSVLSMLERAIAKA